MFRLGYYHGYNGFLVSDFHCRSKEYIDGYLAGMKKEEQDAYYVDMLSSNGDISKSIAERVTL